MVKWKQCSFVQHNGKVGSRGMHIGQPWCDAAHSSYHVKGHTSNGYECDSRAVFCHVQSPSLICFSKNVLHKALIDLIETCDYMRLANIWFCLQQGGHSGPLHALPNCWWRSPPRAPHEIWVGIGSPWTWRSNGLGVCRRGDLWQ